MRLSTEQRPSDEQRFDEGSLVWCLGGVERRSPIAPGVSGGLCPILRASIVRGPDELVGISGSVIRFYVDFYVDVLVLFR